MGRVIRCKYSLAAVVYPIFIPISSIAQRKGGSSIFNAHTSKRVAPAQFRTLDFAEKEGYDISAMSSYPSTFVSIDISRVS